MDKIGKGASGAVRVDDANGGSTLTYGRQFSADSGSLYSSITRETINALKAHFREQVCVVTVFLFVLCSRRLCWLLRCHCTVEVVAPRFFVLFCAFVRSCSGF